MVVKELDIKGSRGGKLIIRVTPYDEVGITEMPKPPEPAMSVYWGIENTERIIEELRSAIEEHKKEKIGEVF